MFLMFDRVSLPHCALDVFVTGKDGYGLEIPANFYLYASEKAIKGSRIGSIWSHLYNFKNVKNTHGGVLLLLKVILLNRCFSRFLNCTNDIKSRKTSQSCDGDNY